MNYRKTDWQAEGIEYHHIQKEKVFDNNIPDGSKIIIVIAGKASYFQENTGFLRRKTPAASTKFVQGMAISQEEKCIFCADRQIIAAPVAA